MEVNIIYCNKDHSVASYSFKIFWNITILYHFTSLFYIEFSNRRVKTFCREIKHFLFAINRFNVHNNMKNNITEGSYGLQWTCDKKRAISRIYRYTAVNQSKDERFDLLRWSLGSCNNVALSYFTFWYLPGRALYCGAKILRCITLLIFPMIFTLRFSEIKNIFYLIL